MFWTKWIKKEAPPKEQWPETIELQKRDAHLSINTKYAALSLSVDDKCPTWFVNPHKKIRRMVIDKNGMICNFPGIQHYERWPSYQNPRTLRRVSYWTAFNVRESGHFILLWTIQPDGHYWGDDGGFGMEDDDEVMLYAVLDDEGLFQAPFRLYKVGRNRYPVEDIT